MVRLTNQSNDLKTSSTINTIMRMGDSASIDAFSRLRISDLETIFDSKNLFNDPDLADSVENIPLFFDNQETSGGGTSTAFNPNQSSQTLLVSNNVAGKRVRQTKMRFNYQPGKSTMAVLTFNLDGASDAGNTKRIGYFDEENGLFLEWDGSDVNLVRRTYVTGSAVDNKVAQDDWNLDVMDGSGTSGVTLDWTKTQIMVIDFQWLGVGRVRIGFDIDGLIHYVHEFLNANILSEAYMSTPNLPIRMSIENDGTGGVDTITQICVSISSEGGMQDLGVIRYASTGGTHLDAAAENTVYALIGIRLKSEYIGLTVNLLSIALQIQTASHQLEWILILNPTIADGGLSYNGLAQSGLEYGLGDTANTVTDGYALDGGFIESGGNPTGGAGSSDRGINTAIHLGSLIDGTVDEIVLCVRPIAGSTDVDVEGSIEWREIL